MKTKWPNLRSLEEPMPAWFAHDHLRRVRRLASRVCRRAGVRAWIDTARSELCFGFIGTDGEVRLPMSVRLYRDIYRRVPSLFDPILDQWNEDDIVYALHLARVDPRRKAAWAKSVETSRKSDERSEFDARLEGTTKRALADTERAYERYSMGRHYRGRAAVSGLRS